MASKTGATNAVLLQDADELYSSNKMAELYELLNKHKDSDDVEIRWRLARVCYKLGKYYAPDKKSAMDLAQQALAHAEKAIELDSSHFAGYKVIWDKMLNKAITLDILWFGGIVFKFSW